MGVTANYDFSTRIPGPQKMLTLGRRTESDVLYYKEDLQKAVQESKIA